MDPEKKKHKWNRVADMRFLRSVTAHKKTGLKKIDHEQNRKSALDVETGQ